MTIAVRGAWLLSPILLLTLLTSGRSDAAVQLQAGDWSRPLRQSVHATTEDSRVWDVRPAVRQGWNWRRFAGGSGLRSRGPASLPLHLTATDPRPLRQNVQLRDRSWSAEPSVEPLAWAAASEGTDDVGGVDVGVSGPVARVAYVIPEPGTIVIWSLLGGCAFVAGRLRRRRV